MSRMNLISSSENVSYGPKVVDGRVIGSPEQTRTFDGEGGGWGFEKRPMCSEERRGGYTKVESLKYETSYPSVTLIPETSTLTNC